MGKQSVLCYCKLLMVQLSLSSLHARQALPTGGAGSVAMGLSMLGTWQALHLAEHRSRPHRREVVLQFIGRRGAIAE